MQAARYEEGTSLAKILSDLAIRRLRTSCQSFRVFALTGQNSWLYCFELFCVVLLPLLAGLALRLIEWHALRMYHLGLMVPCFGLTCPASGTLSFWHMCYRGGFQHNTEETSCERTLPLFIPKLGRLALSSNTVGRRLERIGASLSCQMQEYISKRSLLCLAKLHAYYGTQTSCLRIWFERHDLPVVSFISIRSVKQC